MASQEYFYLESINNILVVAAGVHIEQSSPENMVGESGHMVSIVRKERDFQGMLEYRREDESKLFKILITGDLNINIMSAERLKNTDVYSYFLLLYRIKVKRKDFFAEGFNLYSIEKSDCQSL